MNNILLKDNADHSIILHKYFNCNVGKFLSPTIIIWLILKIRQNFLNQGKGRK